MLTRLLRRAAFGVFFVTLSGCCCCDPAALQEYSEAMGMQEEIEAQMQEEIAKAEAEMARAAEEQAKATAEIEKMQAEPQEMAVEVKPVPKPPTPAGDVAGKFKDTKLDKKALTGGSLKLEVAANKKVSGTFLGQYHRKPFSIPVEGKLKPDNSFELKGKHEDSEITVAGQHGGDTLSGKVTGKVRSKAIVAPFDAKRY